MTQTSSGISNLLQGAPHRWLITGAAGFIGSHLAQQLLKHGQYVVALDNLESGHMANLKDIANHENFTFIEGDIRNLKTCEEAAKDVDYILHHAAIGSVVRSVEDPVYVDQVNNTGFINILMAAQSHNVKHTVYASSSAIYGEQGGEGARVENDSPDPLSPYAVTKCANEHYATALSKTHDVTATGLRYFNIYGPRQDPAGAYAAVIPKWIDAMLSGDSIEIYGDGSTVRDFCYIDDVVQANIRAALSMGVKNKSAIYNVGSGTSNSLNDLFSHLKNATNYNGEAIYKPFRAADIKVSKADISHIQSQLDFTPSTSLQQGLARTVEWYKGKSHHA